MSEKWTNRAKKNPDRSVHQLMQHSRAMAKYITPIKFGEDARERPSMHEERIVAAATHLAHAIAVQQFGVFEVDSVHGDPVEVAKQELLRTLSSVYSMASLTGPDYIFYDFDKKNFSCSEDIFQSRVIRDISAFIGELTLYIGRQRGATMFSEGGSRME